MHIDVNLNSFWPSEFSVIGSIINHNRYKDITNISMAIFKKPESNRIDKVTKHKITDEITPYKNFLSIHKLCMHNSPFFLSFTKNIFKFIFSPLTLAFLTAKDILETNYSMFKSILNINIRFNMFFSIILALGYALPRSFITLIFGLIFYHLFYLINILLRTFLPNKECTNTLSKQPQAQDLDLRQQTASSPITLPPPPLPITPTQSISYYQNGIIYNGKQYRFNIDVTQDSAKDSSEDRTMAKIKFTIKETNETFFTYVPLDKISTSEQLPLSTSLFNPRSTTFQSPYSPVAPAESNI